MTTKTKLTAGQMIKEARLEKDMTQEEIGKLLGFRQGNFVGMMEMNRSAIPYNRIPQICNLLDLSPIALFKLVMMDRDPEMARCLWSI
jgi:transcriptional regulator with XRE-family HTH domain